MVHFIYIDKDITPPDGNGISATFIQSEIDKAKTKGASEIKLIINSPGGDVYEGFAIYNKLMDAKRDGIKISCYVQSLCASIAAFILMAANKEDREAASVSQIMIHNSYVSGASGNAVDLISMGESLNQIDDFIRKTYSDQTNISEDEIKLMLDKETWLTADHAKKINLIGRVVSPVYAKSTIKKNIKMEQNNKSILNKIENIFNRIENVFNQEMPSIKASTDSLEDGTVIYFSEDELIEGVVVYSDESMETVLPAGEYVLSSGMLLVIGEGGVVVSKMEMTNNLEIEMKALKDENEQLKNLLKERESSISNLKKEFFEIKKHIKNSSIKIKTASNLSKEEADERVNKKQFLSIENKIKLK